MKNILSLEEINQYKEDGVVILRDKFDKLCDRQIKDRDSKS